MSFRILQQIRVSGGTIVYKTSLKGRNGFCNPRLMSGQANLASEKTSGIATTTSKKPVPKFGTLKRPKATEDDGKLKNVGIKAGVPFVLFSVLAAWVVSNALDGKLKEMEVSQGKSSKSLRQAKLEVEHDEMLERLNKIVAKDFDNTKRIKRPQEVLEERRLERERRNRWYRRLYRWVMRIPEEAELNVNKNSRK
jgi:hypothetical protein